MRVNDDNDECGEKRLITVQCNSYDGIFQSLSVSRQVSSELHTIIYKETEFRACQRFPNGLKRLAAMGRIQLSLIAT
jgi:hypothetical protein